MLSASLLSAALFASSISAQTTTDDPSVKINPDLVYYNGDYDPHATAAYFADLPEKYVFSMATIRENGDILVHMSAPGAAEWYGGGFGHSMTDSFMFISYPTENGSVITTSPRYSTGQYEPAYDERAEIVKVWGDNYGPNSNLHNPKGISISHFLCRNCTRFIKNFSYEDTHLPMFYAVGPKGEFASDRLDAPISKHAYHGHFTLDMTRATSHLDNYGRVPAPNGEDIHNIGDGTTFTTEFATGPFDTAHDSDYWPIIHGVFMCLAFVIVFPLGALSMRIFQSVIIHIAGQVFGLILVVIGFVGGYFVSMEYIISRSFDTTHQRIGFLIFALVFFQGGIGTVHHLIYKAHQRKLSTAPSIDDPRHPQGPKPFPLNKLHAAFGPLILVLAVINGGLGLQLANSTHLYIPYGVVVGILFTAFIVIRIWTGLYQMPAQYVPDPEMLDQYLKSPVYNSFSASDKHFPGVRIREVPSEETIPMTPSAYSRAPAPYTPATTQRPRAPWEKAESFTSESPYSAASMKTPWSALHEAPGYARNGSTAREPSITEEDEEAREHVHSQTGLSHYASTEQMLPSIQARRQDPSSSPRPGLSLNMHNRI